MRLRTGEETPARLLYWLALRVAGVHPARGSGSGGQGHAPGGLSTGPSCGQVSLSTAGGVASMVTRPGVFEFLSFIKGPCQAAGGTPDRLKTKFLTDPALLWPFVFVVARKARRKRLSGRRFRT